MSRLSGESGSHPIPFESHLRNPGAPGSDRPEGGAGMLTLLQTKISVPKMPANRGTIFRTRLVDQIQHAHEARVVLICAPAGYGKTTLVTQSLDRLPRSETIAWLSLDIRDNDPNRFVAYLFAAVQQAMERVDGSNKSPTGQLRAESPSNMLDRLINQLTLAEQCVVLVI